MHWVPQFKSTLTSSLTWTAVNRIEIQIDWFKTLSHKWLPWQGWPEALCHRRGSISYPADVLSRLASTWTSEHSSAQNWWGFGSNFWACPLDFIESSSSLILPSAYGDLPERSFLKSNIWCTLTKVIKDNNITQACTHEHAHTFAYVHTHRHIQVTSLLVICTVTVRSSSCWQ